MTVLATRFPSRMHRETLPYFFHYIWKLKFSPKIFVFQKTFSKDWREKPHGFSVLAFGDISAWYLANRWSAKFGQRNQSGKCERLRGCFQLPTILTSFKVPYMCLKPSEASDLQKHLKPFKGPMGQLSQLNVGICAAAGILSWQSMPG